MHDFFVFITFEDSHLNCKGFVLFPYRYMDIYILEWGWASLMKWGTRRPRLFYTFSNFIPWTAFYGIISSTDCVDFEAPFTYMTSPKVAIRWANPANFASSFIELRLPYHYSPSNKTQDYKSSRWSSIVSNSNRFFSP